MKTEILVMSFLPAILILVIGLGLIISHVRSLNRKSLGQGTFRVYGVIDDDDLPEHLVQELDNRERYRNHGPDKPQELKYVAIPVGIPVDHRYLTNGKEYPIKEYDDYRTGKIAELLDNKVFGEIIDDVGDELMVDFLSNEHYQIAPGHWKIEKR